MRLMILEDDSALSIFLQKSFQLDGFTVEAFSSAEAGLQRILESLPDLLLLDLGLPGMDGMDVLRTIRELKLNLPVMVLSGRTDLNERVECLNLGADDYVTKPFSLHELTARCRAFRRRRLSHSAGMLQHGDLFMDRIMRTVSYAGLSIEFTAKEFSLLEYLLQKRGRAVPRQELLQEVWRTVPDAGTNVVDVYVNYLRKKLGVAGAAHLIETVRGEGYAIGMTTLASKPPGRVASTPTYAGRGVA